jgi:signal transduction histidine kinase
VKGSNSDGVWNEKGTSVRIIVRPPFWKTAWFLTLSLAAIALLLFSLFRYRVNRLLEMERLRTRIASDLHDELASNLSSIALFSTLVHDASVRQTTVGPDHLKLLERITILSQESVSSIRDIIWAIDPKQETVYSLLMRLRDQVFAHCRAKGIHAHFPEPDPGALHSQNLAPEQRKHLWLLLKEAFTNVIKHAGCTELTVNYHQNNGVLFVRIKDNGAGFDPSLQSRGKGFATMNMRANQLGGTLFLHSAPGQGCTIEVSVPI